MAAVIRFLALVALIAASVAALGVNTPISTIVGSYQVVNGGDSCVRTISIQSVQTENGTDTVVLHNALQKGGVQCSDSGVLAIRPWYYVSSALRQRAEMLNTSDIAKVPYHEDALAAEISVFARGQDSGAYACGKSPSTGSSRQIYTWLDNARSDWATAVMAENHDDAVIAAMKAASGTDVFLQVWTPEAGYDAFSPLLQSSALSVIIVPKGQCWYKKL